MKQKSLICNSAFNVIYQVIYVIFPLITAIYVSNILMAEGIGKVAYAQNIASYFTALAPLGVQNYGVKEIARIKADPEKRNQCFSELFLINAVSTAIVMAVYYGAVIRGEHFERERLLYIVCGLQIALNVINVDWFYKGMEEYAYITMRSLMIKIASMFLLFLSVRTKEDYVQYAFVTTFIGSANSILNVLHLHKFVRLQWKQLRWRRHMRSELVLTGNILLSNLYSKVDITMLGARTTDKITGYYANAFKIINIVLCVCTAMTDVFLPRLSFWFDTDREKYKRLLNHGCEIILAIAFPAAAGVSLLAPTMIPVLFGDTFIPAASTVILLSPLLIIKGFGNLACYQTAISSGNETKQTIAYIGGGLVNILLNAWLIPIMNQNGAAVASVVSELTLNLILFLQLRKLSGIHVRGRYLISVLTSSLMMGIAVRRILQVMSGGLLAAGAAISSGVLVYVFSSYLLGNEWIRMAAGKGKLLLKERKGGRK